MKSGLPLRVPCLPLRVFRWCGMGRGKMPAAPPLRLSQQNPLRWAFVGDPSGVDGSLTPGLPR
ncbi:hypothetical protein LAWASA_1715 [Lawsonibacter asaccharolyticus]|nr:hypothetical protein LAWASA_1715 [Lawsonibacter asaccharolyticus]